MRSIHILLFLFLSLGLTGCSDMAKVTGKVTYPDGTPFTYGNVCFVDGTYEARGRLMPDGTYTVTSIKPGDGLPKGTYKVYFDTMIATTPPPELKVSRVLHTKYGSLDATPLSCEVKGATVFDIEVEKPGG